MSHLVGVIPGASTSSFVTHIQVLETKHCPCYRMTEYLQLGNVDKITVNHNVRLVVFFIPTNDT
jgi:hypothetical protein